MRRLPVLSKKDLNPDSGFYAVIGSERSVNTTILQEFLCPIYNTHILEYFTENSTGSVDDRIGCNLNTEKFMLVLDGLDVNQHPYSIAETSYPYGLYSLIHGKESMESVVVISCAKSEWLSHIFRRHLTGVFISRTLDITQIHTLLNTYIDDRRLSLEYFYGLINSTKHGMYIDCRKKKVFELPTLTKKENL